MQAVTEDLGSIETDQGASACGRAIGDTKAAFDLAQRQSVTAEELAAAG